MTLSDGTSGPIAKCKFYHKDYAISRKGTGRLRRHVYKCMSAHGQVDTTTQTQLQRYPDRSVTTWQFDVMHARECLTRYIAQTDQPISVGESPFYKELIASIYNPQFEPVSRTTIINDLVRLFETQRDDLIVDIRHLTVSIALTSETYEITYRIFSITLDNASVNTSSIALFVARNIPQDGGYFFHQRCACHIINLVVQAGLKQIFYNVTVTLSEVYYPISSQTIHQIVEMSEVLNSYREDDHLGVAVVVMETKLKKYWANIPLLYALSVIVDSRSRFGNIDTPQSTQSETEPKQTSWSILKQRKNDKLTSTSSGQRSGPSYCTELIRYLEAQLDAVEDKEEFDLLLWRKAYTYRYPVLSHLARDVLVIHISTVSSEQTSNTSRRIIEPRRNCLSPEMVEVLICLRGWEHTKKRLQNQTVDKELILNFNNLYIDKPAGSVQCQN
ncbi:hypothetical protein Ddye_001258 [Dipteronia dyeriana]|uniref:HAT C-terminal dimerisation domain-containing protein n=1 Tax=Dipteronia dyeriana TaxID=168575 RepID=A0AAD9XN54_9ROSI|nr:hypothetical protein Ddye_001258 [Dipteronia dyeriana]